MPSLLNVYFIGWILAISSSISKIFSSCRVKVYKYLSASSGAIRMVTSNLSDKTVHIFPSERLENCTVGVAHAAFMSTSSRVIDTWWLSLLYTATSPGFKKLSCGLFAVVKATEPSKRLTEVSAFFG